ncbi:MAG: adenylosuccinate lyase [Microbacteriaceae bacterium]|nr:adenylosuccinate lyase [Microbacteriaceae bacterium]
MSELTNQPLSPLDGRYQSQVSGLSEFFSEAGLNKARVQVEIEWLIRLAGSDYFEVEQFTDDQQSKLRELYENFNAESHQKITEIEATTRHDVKAVEYFIREHLDALGLTDRAELVHFSCTSEDINNLAYALVIKQATEQVWLPKAKKVQQKLVDLAHKNADLGMLSRTHGQPATPTTLGKELAVFAHRLQRQILRVENQQYLGKFSGATGTFAAHLSAKPEADWLAEAEEFVQSLGLSFNSVTTQIESHDWQAELYQAITHFNRILHNLATDVWTYISLGYFKQTPVEGATGSSTMPHKINPIRFENAEANLELSNAILDSLNQTLVTSRLQRDLTDSSAQRNIGVGFGHSVLALDNIDRGLDELEVDRVSIRADLLDAWEVLAEAVQTVIRSEVAEGKSSIQDPYAMLKELTRGKGIDEESLAGFIAGLDISQSAKDRLLLLKPENYVGLASKIAESV